MLHIKGKKDIQVWTVKLWCTNIMVGHTNVDDQNTTDKTVAAAVYIVFIGTVNLDKIK